MPPTTTPPSSSSTSTSSPPPPQPFDYTTLAAVVHELGQHYTPSKIEGVIQCDHDTIVLKIRTTKGTHHLYLSWHPLTSRLVLGAPPARGARSEAYSFGELLSGKLIGLIITQISLPTPWERVVRIVLAPRLSDEPVASLVLELMGRHSNLVLVGGGKVLAAGRQVGETTSRVRQLTIGKEYAYPPFLSQGASPDDIETVSQFSQALREGSVVDALVTGFFGVSPALARAMLVAARVRTTCSTDELFEELDDLDRLFCVFVAWRKALKEGRFQPEMLDGRSFCVIALSQSTSPPSSLSSSSSSSSSSSVLDFLSSYYRPQQGEAQLEARRSQLLKQVADIKKRVSTKTKSLAAQLVQASNHEMLQHQGDLLMAAMHLIKSGDECVTINDWLDQDAPKTLPLDPALSPQDNVQAYYKRARKARRAIEHVNALLEKAEQDAEYLQSIELALQQLTDAADDLQAVEEIRDELVSQEWMKRASDSNLASKAASKAKKGGGGSQPYRTFTSPSGKKVLVGRNNVQNDKLSIQTANPEDLWFHARAIPGAHVVLRGGGDEVDVRFAASLASFYSKARNDVKVSVTVCKAKHVKKIKGMPPGMVRVENDWTVLGMPGDVADLVGVGGGVGGE